MQLLQKETKLERGRRPLPRPARKRRQQKSALSEQPIWLNTLDVPFYLDDRPNIVENPYVRLTDLTSKNIACAAFKSPLPNRPIANLSFALNYYFHKFMHYEIGIIWGKGRHERLF